MVAGRSSFAARPWSDDRRVLRMLARHDLRRLYAGSMAGPAWAIVTPLVPLVILAAVFSIGLRSTLGGAPYLYGFAAGYAPWLWMSGALAGATGAVVDQRHLVKHAGVSVRSVSLSPVLVHGAIHLVLVALVLVASFAHGDASIGALPWLLWFGVCTLALVAPLALALGAMTAVVRDVRQGTPVALQAWFWLTPIAWTPELAPTWARSVVRTNPATYVVDGYRHALLPGAFASPGAGAALRFAIVVGLVAALSWYCVRRLRDEVWESV